MRIKPLYAVLMLSTIVNPSFGAIKTKTVPIDNFPTKHFFSTAQQFPFQMEIIGDQSGLFSETVASSKIPSIRANKNERYTIRLTNPLPVRVAVNLSVDGLNSISGKPCGVQDGDKWMIPPQSSIVIRGWQVNSNENRRFFFTDKPKSYAKWRSKQLDKDLTVNCGIIGAAFFWNRAELAQAFQPEQKTEKHSKDGFAQPSSESLGNRSQPYDLKRSVENIAEAKQQKAGTGMGEREQHQTTQVEFVTDDGMMSPDEALLIAYDFAPAHRPQAFPGTVFAPEMPY